MIRTCLEIEQDNLLREVRDANISVVNRAYYVVCAGSDVHGDFGSDFDCIGGRLRGRWRNLHAPASSFSPVLAGFPRAGRTGSGHRDGAYAMG